MADGRRYQSRKGYDRNEEKAKATELAVEQLGTLVMENAPVGFTDIGSDPVSVEGVSLDPSVSDGDAMQRVVFQSANFEAAGQQTTLGQLLARMEPMGTVESQGQVDEATPPSAKVTVSMTSIQTDEQLAEVDAIDHAQNSELDIDSLAATAVSEPEPQSVDPVTRMPAFKKSSKKSALDRVPLRSSTSSKAKAKGGSPKPVEPATLQVPVSSEASPESTPPQGQVNEVSEVDAPSHLTRSVASPP